MHAYFCSIVRKRVGMKREAGGEGGGETGAIFTLDAGGPGSRCARLSSTALVHGRKGAQKPRSSFIFDYTSDPPANVLPDTKNIRHFRHWPNYCALPRNCLSRNFLLHDQFFPPFPFLIPRFLFLFLFLFSIYPPHTTLFPPLRVTSLLHPPHPGSLTVPPRSPLTPSPSPAPSPSSLAASVWRWPELINNSRL